MKVELSNDEIRYLMDSMITKDDCSGYIDNHLYARFEECLKEKEDE